MATATAGPIPKDHAAVERRAREIGREIFREAGGGPSWLDRAWWDDRLMGLTMDDPRVKVQLFRFIDALPTLPDDASVRRHLEEYLGEAEGFVPPMVRLPLAAAPRGPVEAAYRAASSIDAALWRTPIGGSGPTGRSGNCRCSS